MYQFNPFCLQESLHLDPTKIDIYLKDPNTRKLLMKAKHKIHRNPYLRDKFYDIVSLTHQTNKANVPSIMKSGLLRSKSGSAGTDTAAMIKQGLLDPQKSKVVYTMKNGTKAPLDISAVHEPIVLKLRVPASYVKRHRVADPMMPDYVGHNWQNYSIGKLFKKSLKDDSPLTFERFAAKYYGMTPKQLRTKWSTLPAVEKLKLQKQFGGRAGHQSIYSKGSFNQSVRDTVALDNDIKPEWIVGSPVSKKFNFEDQLKQDPQRTVSMINDLMKRS